MSMLARYKKTGGFVQLLALIEGFGQQKKEKFLEMIDQESPVWSKALREKMLSVERVMGWPDQVVIEIFKTLPVKNMAVAMAGLKPEQLAKVTPFITPSDKRKMEDALNGETPKPEEITASLVKVIDIARKMIKEGDLHPEKFDVALKIPEEFEASLDSGAVAAGAIASDAVVPANGEGSASAGAAPALSFELKPAKVEGLDPKSQADFAQLQKTALHLSRENSTLKAENKVLKEKLEQIRRIA